MYADTSVFGGCFDEEFAVASQRLFEEIRVGRFVLVVSPTTLRELDAAPPQVSDVLTSLPAACIESLQPSDEVTQLRDAYLAADIVGAGSALDAEHIASASVVDVDLIVSWNFKHIVHFEKVRGYHAINLLRGYSQVPIHSPIEVIES
ncbi:MAG: PIN domain protein [Planctomycetota bacterium]